jgi:hypothetical protein
VTALTNEERKTMFQQAHALQAVRMLDLMLEFFDGGRRWTQMRFENGSGGRCLFGAINHLSDVHPDLSPDGAISYLFRAMPTKRMGLAGFNDRARDYSEIAQLIEDARTLAQAQATPPQRRRAKPPADRQRHSALIHADRAVPAQ